MGTPGRKGTHPFIAFLHDVRVRKGMSQGAVHRAGGPRQPCVSQLETGMQQPTLYNLASYARSVGFAVALVDGKGNVYELPDGLE